MVISSHNGMKKDGSWCSYIDYHKLVKCCNYSWFMPTTTNFLCSWFLAGATYFTTLDLAFGYWQVAVGESDKEKPYSLQLKVILNSMYVMPFSLNAPATFHRLMECVLPGLVEEESLIYLDDVVVFKAHLLCLTRILQALCSWKCQRIIKFELLLQKFH